MPQLFCSLALATCFLWSLNPFTVPPIPFPKSVFKYASFHDHFGDCLMGFGQCAVQAILYQGEG